MGAAIAVIAIAVAVVLSTAARVTCAVAVIAGIFTDFAAGLCDVNKALHGTTAPCNETYHDTHQENS